MASDVKSGDSGNLEGLAADGEVCIIKITDKQFGRIEVFYGKKHKSIEKPPGQLSFF